MQEESSVNSMLTNLRLVSKWNLHFFLQSFLKMLPDEQLCCREVRMLIWETWEFKNDAKIPRILDRHLPYNSREKGFFAFFQHDFSRTDEVNEEDPDAVGAKLP